MPVAGNGLQVRSACVPRDPRLTFCAVAASGRRNRILRNQEHVIQGWHHFLPSCQVTGQFDQQLKQESSIRR